MPSNHSHPARTTPAILLIGGLMVGASMPQVVQAQTLPSGATLQAQVPPLPRNLPPIQRPDPTIPTQPLAGQAPAAATPTVARRSSLRTQAGVCVECSKNI
ncbi:MAG: hypothetical protein HC860_15060, partial [Alkalinema sp. RU_4_3]|nr:hypothetical protein [Alkalinema sp. RU_4_3]